MTATAPTTETPRPTAAQFAWHALRYGGVAGLAGGAWMIADYALGFQTERLEIGRWTSLVSMVIPIAAVILGLMAWRNKALGGRIRFVQAFGVALGVGLVFATCMGAIAWLQAAKLAPDLIERQIQRRAAYEAAQPNADPAAIAQRAEDNLKVATPLMWGRFVFSRMLMQSLFVGLVAAITVPKKQPGLD